MPPRRRAAWQVVPGWLWAAIGYLGLSIVMWWHVWTGHPAQTMTCGCADPASFVWFLAWPAYALEHGQNLFFSNRVHAPGGFNVLANTSVLGIGIPLAPVTWLFGPVATLNVALTLAPSVSAISAYGCLRATLKLWGPAAFLGGLAFGFSPSMLGNEAIAHLQLTWLALLPVLFLCVHQLVMGRADHWWRWGLLFGVVVAAQFFIGLEMLTVALLTVAAGLGLTLVAALVVRPPGWSRRLATVCAGTLLGAVVAGMLLAYPAWFVLAGPEHVRGPVATILGQPFRAIALPSGGGVTTFGRIVGYLGPGGSTGAYVGIAALVLVLVALVVVRRPMTVLATALVVGCLWCALGASRPYAVATGAPSWLPLVWRPFANVALLENIEPPNFAAPATFFIGVTVALLVDRLHQVAVASWPRRLTHLRRSPRHFRWSVGIGVVAAAAGVALVVPWVRAYPLPYVTTTVHLPRWFSSGDLPAHDAVVLFSPYPASQQDQALLWQARAAMPFRLVGGRGLVPAANGRLDTESAPGTTEERLNALSAALSLLPEPGLPSRATVASTRRFLVTHHVDEVVVSERGRNPQFARRWYTSVLGVSPVRQADVWVWPDVARDLR